ncbi:uncharacterized protein ASPGLDRAFT_1474205 [Aspergillus glaucus CBS 516.65]|uniref:Uncharacterized protein n=1 Tax=Aspergillus glaucus CBS 516.65 TaxID=1160497 RepID=A0A1L9VLK4_ASPGL|nr:hypothetical protein ASPGLDRAFT_1474205 [Aspergillus glaucus CBS 516.65]OJJ84809.1 hypothetical protein ASPGLDRAFT_1474205 [Aspergillus glaucus CBS 516.65]
MVLFKLVFDHFSCLLLFVFCFLNPPSLILPPSSPSLLVSPAITRIISSSYDYSSPIFASHLDPPPSLQTAPNHLQGGSNKADIDVDIGGREQ